MDLSPIQRTSVPGNCEFMVGDLREELPTFNDGSVDLLHSRYVCKFNDLRVSRFVHLGLQVEEWPNYVKEIFRVLKPGSGWAQVSEGRGMVFENDIEPPDSVLPRVSLLNPDPDAN